MLTSSSELNLFVKFCQARSTLYNRFNQCSSDNNDQFSDVSLHSLLDIFEFLYMLHVTKIDSGAKIALVGQAHNAECEVLLKADPSSLARLGLNKTKIKDAIFTDRNLKKLSSNYELASAIDQSDMSRFLFKHMSRETTRKALIMFNQAGLLRRLDAGDSVLIKSNGEAEKVFKDYLDRLMR